MGGESTRYAESFRQSHEQQRPVNGHVLRRLHNPRSRSCGCDPVCWCQRRALGRAVRWWLPGRWFGLPHISAGSAAWKQQQAPES